MAKYKVLVIGLLVSSNVVKKYGDVVDESELIGKTNDLLKEGFIELVLEEQKQISDNQEKADQEAADLRANEDQEKADQESTDLTENENQEKADDKATEPTNKPNPLAKLKNK